MNTNDYIMMMLFVLAVGLAVVGGVLGNPPFPEAMVVENDQPLVLREGWTACEIGWLSPGHDIGVYDPYFFTIDKAHHGALLTVNLDRPMNIRLYGDGGELFGDRIYNLGFAQSAVWQIQNVHDRYYVEVEGHEGEILELCRYSVQVNR